MFFRKFTLLVAISNSKIVTKCKDWTQLASRLNKVTQSVEIREGNYSSSAVGKLLRNNNDVDLKYLL